VLTFTSTLTLTLTLTPPSAPAPLRPSARAPERPSAPAPQRPRSCGFECNVTTADGRPTDDLGWRCDEHERDDPAPNP
jgi:hypothetical protein